MNTPTHTPDDHATKVPRWRFSFMGRRKGALGVLSEHAATREGLTQDLARVQLYDEYEHITVLQTRRAPW